MAKKKPAIIAIKGFDKDLKCRDYQFAIGKKFKHDGDVEACKSGFHSVEYPLDVFKYYSPVDSRYCEVIASGDISRHDDDSKIASAEIKINAELRMPEIVSRAIAYIMDRIEGDSKIHNTGNRSAASNTGNRSAASNTGNQSAASNTGNRSAASNTGNRSAASNTGNRSAASNTGDYSAASKTGNQSAASDTGDQSAASNTGNQSAASNTGNRSAPQHG